MKFLTNALIVLSVGLVTISANEIQKVEVDKSAIDYLKSSFMNFPKKIDDFLSEKNEKHFQEWQNGVTKFENVDPIIKHKARMTSLLNRVVDLYSLSTVKPMDRACSFNTKVYFDYSSTSKTKNLESVYDELNEVVGFTLQGVYRAVKGLDKIFENLTNSLDGYILNFKNDVEKMVSDKLAELKANIEMEKKNVKYGIHIFGIKWLPNTKLIRKAEQEKSEFEQKISGFHESTNSYVQWLEAEKNDLLKAITDLKDGFYELRSLLEDKQSLIDDTMSQKNKEKELGDEIFKDLMYDVVYQSCAVVKKESYIHQLESY